MLLRLDLDQVSDSHGLIFKQKSIPPVYFDLDVFRAQEKAHFREAYLLDLEDIWAQSDVIDLRDTEVNQMRAEHLLLFLCLHLAERHHFERLIWIRDLREVIDHYGRTFDWNYFINCAERWRAKSYAYFSLLLAERLALAIVPTFVMDKLRPDYLSAKLFEKLLFIDDMPGLPMKTTSLRFQLLSLLGDNFTRRAWAELVFPYHMALRLFKVSNEQI